MSQIKVIRGQPEDRNRLERLTGYLRFNAKVLAPVHVGGTGTRLRGAEHIVEKAETLEGDVEHMLRELQVLVREELVRRDMKDIFTLRGMPTIPGSSLKGAVRSRLEFSFVPHNRTIPSCFSVSGGRPFVARQGESGWRHQRIYPASLDDRGPPCDYLKFGSVCKVCDIFGSPGLAARVHFPSLTFDCDTDEFQTSFGPVEVIPSGCGTQGSMSFVNMEPYELGLVLIGMGNLKPLLIGFGKYRFGSYGSHPGGVMGRIVITPTDWSLLPTAADHLKELGVTFTGERRLRPLSALELWNKLVEEAKAVYPDHLREVEIDAGS